MAIILYNIEKNQIEHRFENDYFVDGQPGIVTYPLTKLIEQLTEQPQYDSQTQYLVSDWIVQDDKYIQTWEIVNKTQEQLISEKNSEAIAAEQNFNIDEMKNLLKILANDLPESEMYKYVSIYPSWKVDIAVNANEKYQYNDKLYKVIQSHTTQLDWTPDVVPALFTIYNPPDIIPEWVQPTGAHDSYPINSKVTHNGNTWESYVDSNVWEPGVYGWNLI